jgi:glyoxylase-like metal-dependent hydrolase (beta-lactamase superfamily II)
VLKQVADGVFVQQSEWSQTNAVVVQGDDGVLLIDPGIHEAELARIASDVSELGQTVVVGFSTHPHWDHMVWHEAFGTPPRYSTERCAESARARLANGIDLRRFGVPDDVPLDLLGKIEGLPVGAERIPWDGPTVRILEHRAHAPGHASLFIEDRGVLVAGDMLSDILIPMLDLMGAVDPIEDYLAALRLLDGVAGDASVVIPGHGTVGNAEELRKRLNQDRTYVEALANREVPVDGRVGSAAGVAGEWATSVHEMQLGRLAELRGSAGTSA